LKTTEMLRTGGYIKAAHFIANIQSLNYNVFSYVLYL